HLPDVFMTRPDHRAWIPRQYLFQELAERTFPALCTVVTAEGAQGIDEIGTARWVRMMVRRRRERLHRPSLPRNQCGPLGGWTDAGVSTSLLSRRGRVAASFSVNLNPSFATERDGPLLRC